MELPDDFPTRNRTEQLKFVAEAWLSSQDARSPDTAKSGKEIIDGAVRPIQDEWGITDAGVHTYLSQLVRDNTSSITSRGRRQGFYLTDETAVGVGAAEDSKAPEDEESAQLRSNRTQREKPFYRVFQDWLGMQGYTQVKDTSAIRTRELGAWSNPDLTGIRTFETLGELSEIEIATIEVKPTADNWQYEIFEAVAHRRLSNRTYFAFSHREDGVQKIEADLRNYAELYSIGVLVLPLPDEVYRAAQYGQEEALEEIYASDIVELMNAPKTPTNYAFRDRFLRGLGISTGRELNQWGVGNLQT